MVALSALVLLLMACCTSTLVLVSQEEALDGEEELLSRPHLHLLQTKAAVFRKNHSSATGLPRDHSIGRVPRQHPSEIHEARLAGAPVQNQLVALLEPIEVEAGSVDDSYAAAHKLDPLGSASAGVWTRLFQYAAVPPDIFPEPHRHGKGRPRTHLLDAESSEWTVLVVTVLVLVLLDYLIFQRFTDCPATHAGLLCFWISVGVGYNLYFGSRYGMKLGIDWCTGYCLEWLLSVDNLFVFHLVFKIYKTPSPLMHKALFFGILGAVVFRVLFFLALGSLLHMVHWVRFVFGAVLIYSGIQAVREDDDFDISDSYAVRALRACFGSRLQEIYPNGSNSFFVFDNEGRLCVTLLLYIVFCLEATDILFAIDSVSAKVAQIPNQYVAYSSSVLALFGLRAMFFIIKDLVEYFELLKFGLCFILVFIGCELLLSNWITLHPGTVCIVIVSVFVLCIAASAARIRIRKEVQDELNLDDEDMTGRPRAQTAGGADQAAGNERSRCTTS